MTGRLYALAAAILDDEARREPPRQVSRCPTPKGGGTPGQQINGPRREAVPPVPSVPLVPAGPVSHSAGSAQDWRDYVAERAAIIEHDAGQPRVKAEAEAYRAAIARWMLLDPPPTSGTPECCAHCGHGPKPGQVILPFGAATAATWLHHWCWPEWCALRRAKAEAALAILLCGAKTE